MGTLGHKVFVPLGAAQDATANEPTDNDEEPILYLKTAKANATGRRTSDGFVVLKGSKVSAKPVKSCPDIIQHLREKFADRVDDSNVFTEDTLFSSPYAAAVFVTYDSVNGLTM